jgi:hypothetical protein
MAVGMLAREQGGLISVYGPSGELAALLFGGTEGGELCVCDGEGNLLPEGP